jgi:hypothetical protein
MRLVRAEIVASGPFERVDVSLADDEGEPRPLTVIHGTGGVGKSTLLQAIATTRPGHAIAQLPRADLYSGEAATPSHSACSWLLGDDEPARPHVLCVASPNVRWLNEESAETLRRREQAHYDRLAHDGGFAFLAIPGARWFSRQPMVLSAPSRSIARYDVRAPLAFDENARNDLARETKQSLAYAAIAAVLAGAEERDGRRFDLLAEAMRAAVDRLGELGGFRYLGIDPLSFEPIFAAASGRRLAFDALPTRVRHLLAFAALPVRLLWAAYPDQDPRESEGVIAIDDVELYQDDAALARLGAAVREVLPRAQWLLTTASPVLAASAAVSEVIALRRLDEGDRVAAFAGQQGVTH